MLSSITLIIIIIRMVPPPNLLRTSPLVELSCTSLHPDSEQISLINRLYFISCMIIILLHFILHTVQANEVSFLFLHLECRDFYLVLYFVLAVT